jgi:serine/threonine-protein phosphatase 2A regulatory subunit B
MGEADIISTVEFDQTGNYLATGDKGGRVVLFERNGSVSAYQTISIRSDSTDDALEEDMRIQISH